MLGAEHLPGRPAMPTPFQSTKATMHPIVWALWALCRKPRPQGTCSVGKQDMQKLKAPVTCRFDTFLLQGA